MVRWIIIAVIIAVLVAAIIVLYIMGRRTRKRQDAQQEQIEATKQMVSMLIIDKKRMPVKSSGLPQTVIDQTPRLMRRSKLPIVKAKVGPRIMTLVSDAKIYDQIPIKKEVKAEVSGMYIVSVRGVHGSLEKPPEKKGFFRRLFRRR